MDPRPLTLRQLVLMKDGKDEHDWSLNAQLCYTVACLLSKNPSKIKRENFNLYLLGKKASQTPKKATPEQLKQFAQAFIHK